jgi:hypothetical protein
MKIELTAENTRQALLETLINMYAHQCAFSELVITMHAGTDDAIYKHYIQELNKVQKEKVAALMDAFYANYGTLDLSQLYDKPKDK